MLDAGTTAVSGRGVLPVVAGQIEVHQVNERVPAMLLDHGVARVHAGFHRAEVRLVVAVWIARSLAESREEGRDAARREVLQLAVELMTPGILPDLRHIRFPQCENAR